MRRKIEINDDIVLLERKQYDMLVNKLNVIHDYVSGQLDKYRKREDDRLVTMQEIILYLKISKTTAYKYLNQGKLVPSCTIGKNLFRIGDVKDAFNKGYIKTTEQYLQNLINNHVYQQYQRFDPHEDEQRTDSL